MATTSPSLALPPPRGLPAWNACFHEGRPENTGSTRTSRVGAGRSSRVTVVGRHPVHAGKRHGAVALDPEVNRESPENRFVLVGVPASAGSTRIGLVALPLPRRLATALTVRIETATVISRVCRSFYGSRGISSAGRASEWHSEGQRFEPAILHRGGCKRKQTLANPGKTGVCHFLLRRGASGCRRVLHRILYRLLNHFRTAIPGIS